MLTAAQDCREGTQLSELRWHPLLEQWVITATHRQERTFFPPDDYCPLCPTDPDGVPTEVPAENYELVTFENRFPSLERRPPKPSVKGTNLYKVRPSQGVCEVVLYSPEHVGTLSDKSEEEINHVICVWTDRYVELGALDFVDYVFIFENKGREIGVTLTHPHGQIYAYPFVPPIVQKEIDSSAQYERKTGNCLTCDILSEELSDDRRIIIQNDGFVALVPFYARYPYEVHVISNEHRVCLPEFSDGERLNLARILKTVLLKYDNLWGFSLPYIMVLHQRPTDGREYGHYHFHIEFYPPYRTKDKLKFLAGSESGAGVFINDTLPEEKARELREAEPKT